MVSSVPDSPHIVVSLTFPLYYYSGRRVNDQTCGSFLVPTVGLRFICTEVLPGGVRLFLGETFLIIVELQCNLLSNY